MDAAPRPITCLLVNLNREVGVASERFGHTLAPILLMNLPGEAPAILEYEQLSPSQNHDSQDDTKCQVSIKQNTGKLVSCSSSDRPRRKLVTQGGACWNISSFTSMYNVKATQPQAAGKKESKKIFRGQTGNI